MSLLDRFTKNKTAKQLEEKSVPKTAKASKVVKAKKEAAPDVEAKEVAPAVATRPAMVGGIAHRIIVGPLVTEKSAILQSSANQYAFVVNKTATKALVKQAVKELYGVDAKKIRVINMQGRSVRFGQGMGRRQDFKKAIVQLVKGQSITMHEGV